MSTAHEWAVRVISMIFVIVGTITEACRASISDTFVIRISAFSSYAGVTDVVTRSVLSARSAFDLIQRNGWIVPIPWYVVVAPVLPLHEAHNTPGHTTSEVPGPYACGMSFSACELSMSAIASLGKAAALKVLEVILQVFVTDDKLRRLLDRITV